VFAQFQISRMIFFIVLINLFIAGCCVQMDKKELKQILIKTDSSFSRMSVEKGIKSAFDFYMDDTAVMYRDNSHPIKGRENINKLFNSEATDTLRWKPTFADVAESGDLGYTLGEYSYTSEQGKQSMGYYVSIWKKQENGDWKYVFDSGINAPKK